MPMHKQANGGNFQVSGGDLTIEFDGGKAPVVYAVCVWGPKPEFGGHRPKLWCTDTRKSRKDGATVTIPGNMAVAGAQVTWSGGVIAPAAAQGRLLVTVSQDGTSNSYAYEYNFARKNETESFYDGLNFT